MIIYKLSTRLTILLFVTSIRLFAQQPTPIWFDSVFQQGPSKKSSEEILRMLESDHMVAIENHDGTAETVALINLAAFQATQLKNYGKALDWLLRSLEIADSSKKKADKVFTFAALARVFNVVGEWSESIKYLDQARALVTENDFVLFNFVLNERGQALMLMGNTDESIADYELILKYARISESLETEADALYHLGVLHAMKKDFDLALKAHRDALAIRRSLKNKAKEAQSLNSVGQLYLAQKNFERAKANHMVALDIRKKLKDEEGLAETYYNMGALYIAQKDFKQAIKNLESGLDNSKTSPEASLKIHEALSRCYKQQGNFKEALRHQELYSGLSDVINEERDKDALLQVQSQHAIQKQENKIGKLAADMKESELVIEEQKRERKFLLGFIGLGLVIGALIVWLYLQKRRSNKMLKEINATKDKLFSIIGHDLKGPLNSLTAFSSLLLHHADGLTKEEIKMLSADVDKSLKNLFGLLENLLEWARSQTGNIDFTPVQFDIGALINENLELLKPLASKKNLKLEYAAASIMVSAHKNSINTVIRNLISNAIKFTREGGRIVLQVQPKEKFVQLAITDNGIGMNKDIVKKLFKVGEKISMLGTAKEKGTGLGLVLCKDFVEKNGGTIGVESEEGKGSRFWFTIKSVN